jgi:MSHA biogenesis protein MshE
MDTALIRELGRGDPTRFAEAARAQMGKNTLQNGALKLALQGRTTLAEAMKLAVNESVPG